MTESNRFLATDFLLGFTEGRPAMRTRLARRSSSPKSRFGSPRQLLRAIIVEGLGLGALALLVGYPLLTSQRWHVSCLDTRPSVVDASLQVVFSKIGLVPKSD